MSNLEPTSDFIKAFRGSFTGILRWPQLDEFWQVMNEHADDNWYIYAVGEAPPQHTSSADELKHFIIEIDKLVRSEHEEDYCGIVYVDNKTSPTFVKIFDPNNLGVSCGFSDFPPFPGWIISRIQPEDLKTAIPPPQSRKRWWQKLFNR
ncbi:MAG: hypothetical protein R3240_06690 [Gammaproteobacteria bacterium]|nr:hypothetical protein [Gammaproteobacteria bacterium]